MTPNESQARLCRIRAAELRRAQHALDHRRPTAARARQEDAEALAAGIIALEREIAREVINLAAPGHSSTETLIAALRHLAGEIVAPDDIAATALREAADRLEALAL